MGAQICPAAYSESLPEGSDARSGSETGEKEQKARAMVLIPSTAKRICYVELQTPIDVPLRLDYNATRRPHDSKKGSKPTAV